MIPRVVEETGFTVVGISIRTSNANEMSGKGVIAQQWDRFMKEGLLGKIANKVNSNILAVYIDYESDANGAYTFMIGARVSSADDIPVGMVAKTWSRIWAIPKSSPGRNRAYRADFEVYDQRAANPQNAEVDIYVGIK